MRKPRPKKAKLAIRRETLRQLDVSHPALQQAAGGLVGAGALGGQEPNTTRAPAGGPVPDKFC